jgi:hypothetical protein
VRRTPTPHPSGRADQRTGRARGVMFALLPKSGHRAGVARCLLCAISDRSAAQKKPPIR